MLCLYPIIVSPFECKLIINCILCCWPHGSVVCGGTNSVGPCHPQRPSPCPALGIDLWAPTLSGHLVTPWRPETAEESLPFPAKGVERFLKFVENILVYFVLLFFSKFQDMYAGNWNGKAIFIWSVLLRMESIWSIISCQSFKIPSVINASNLLVLCNYRFFCCKPKLLLVINTVLCYILRN